MAHETGSDPDCDCDVDPLVFPVPSDCVEAAPTGAEALSICPRCLDINPADSTAVEASPDFSTIVSGFPEGRAGAAMALAVGLLVDSVALHREAVATCFDVVADAGEDPWLVIERLAIAPTVQPDADLERIRRQLDQLSG